VVKKFVYPLLSDIDLHQGNYLELRICDCVNLLKDGPKDDHILFEVKISYEGYMRGFRIACSRSSVRYKSGVFVNSEGAFYFDWTFYRYLQDIANSIHGVVSLEVPLSEIKKKAYQNYLESLKEGGSILDI